MSRLKKHFKFTTQEWLHLGITAFIIGIILSFRQWGEGSFDVNAGVESLIIFTVLSFIALLAHFSAQKWYGIRKGHDVRYVSNYAGHGVALLITILFNGLLFILAPGWSEIKTKEKQRIGKWRFRPYFREYGFLAMNGIFANLVLAGLFGFFSNPIALAFVKVNLLIAVFSLIPAPRFDGFHLFFASFYQYAFIVSFTLAYAVLLFYVNVFLAAIFALVIGIIGFFAVFKQLT